jgi:hypothetical protein
VSQGDEKPAIVKMPARWDDGALANLHGQVCFLRKFGAPRQVDEGEVTWLIFRDFPTAVIAELNGRTLGTSATPTFEFPAALETRNRLQLTMTAPENRACTWGEVTLQIRRSAWLADLSLTPVGPNGWKVAGAVVGASPEPLELYVMAGGQQLHYREILPLPEGQLFEAVFTRPQLREVKVDLVNVATVWYSRILQAPSARGEPRA